MLIQLLGWSFLHLRMRVARWHRKAQLLALATLLMPSDRCSAATKLKQELVELIPLPVHPFIQDSRIRMVMLVLTVCLNLALEVCHLRLILTAVDLLIPTLLQAPQSRDTPKALMVYTVKQFSLMITPHFMGVKRNQSFRKSKRFSIEQLRPYLLKMRLWHDYLPL